jgi:hypothetical protein
MRHRLSLTGYNAVTSTTTNTPRPADLYDTRLAEPGRAEPDRPNPH